MARVLRDAPIDTAPVAVPVPGTWDPVAQAAYEQGRADGYAHGMSVGDREGYARGRSELEAVAERVVNATARCHDEVRRLHAELIVHTIELADLYVRTVVRGCPDASARSMLARVEEALHQLEPDRMELAVEPAVVDEFTALFAAADRPLAVDVVPDDSLEPGEFRLRTEWAEAEGTWEHYMEAASEAMTMYLAEHS